MDLGADLPVTLVVKAANQRVADQTVECVLGWTIRKLKQHLESVYPSKPKHHQQKLIYSGQLLADHLTLKEVLRQIDQNSQHTVHLVCSPSVESLTQPGPSQSAQSYSSTEKKSEPHTNMSQSSLSSPSDSDGLRHRGAQVSNASSSHSDVANTGGNQAMTAPAGAGMPGTGAMVGMGGVPMMGAGAPMMGMPGYSYTPEQIAWMQQMYSQYMAQYMQYYGYQAPAPAQPVIQTQAPAPQPAANPAPVNNAPPNQNMRMNAQGGMEEDDEEEQRDWLDYIYVCFRFLILACILYFYSSASRFFAVAAGVFFLYLLRNRFGLVNQPREQPQDAQQPPAQPQPQQQQQQQQQPAQDQAEGNRAEGHNDSAPEEEREQEADPAAPSDDNQQAAEPEQDTPSTSMVLLRMLLSFFTSLVPERPPVVNGN